MNRIIIALSILTNSLAQEQISGTYPLNGYLELGGYRCDNTLDAVTVIGGSGTDNKGATVDDDRDACGLSCTGDDDCVAFNFNPDQTKECYLLSGSCTTHTSISVTHLKGDGVTALDATFSVYFNLTNYCTDNVIGTSVNQGTSYADSTTANNGELCVDGGGLYCTTGCPDATACTEDDDCLSDRCESHNGADQCVSCSDTIITGDETCVINDGIGTNNGGGTFCGALCLAGDNCNIDNDCNGGTCFGGTNCQTCSDGVINQGETDVDCGGICGTQHGKTCGLGEKCDDTTDCSGTDKCWTNGITPGLGNAASWDSTKQRCISCSDGGGLNGAETGTNPTTGNECGGDTGCDRCEDTVACIIDSDCATQGNAAFGGTCFNNVCVSCNDGDENNGETDVDCGGTCKNLMTPKLCQGNQKCGNIDDCAVGIAQGGSCSGGLCVSCSDGAKNGDETGEDCGGDTGCDRCGGGHGCISNGDCGLDDQGSQLLCSSNDPISDGVNGFAYDSDNSCVSCFDGVKNQDETDVDSGGSTCADRSQTNEICAADSDCEPDHSCVDTSNTCQLTTSSPTTAAPTNAPHKITFTETFYDGSFHDTVKFKTDLSQGIVDGLASINVVITTTDIDILSVNGGSVIVEYYVIGVTQIEMETAIPFIVPAIRSQFKGERDTYVEGTAEWAAWNEVYSDKFEIDVPSDDGEAIASQATYTVAPTKAPTPAPTRAVHLPDNWDWEDPNYMCRSGVGTGGVLPEAEGGGDPLVISYIEDYTPENPANGAYTFNVKIAKLLDSPTFNGNPQQYSGWLFITKDANSKAYSTADPASGGLCQFDVDPSDDDTFGGNDAGRYNQRIMPLKFQLDLQQQNYIGNGQDGMPYTLKAGCADISSAYTYLNDQDGNPDTDHSFYNKLVEEHTFAVHFAQCTESSSLSQSDCEETGIGLSLFNMWKGVEGDGPYNSINMASVTDTGTGLSSWSALGFNPLTPFVSDNAPNAELDFWLKDYITGSGGFTSAAAQTFMNDKFRVGASGKAAECIIHSQSVTLLYALPTIISTNDLEFNTQFVYNPTIASDGNVESMIIAGNIQAINAAGALIPSNLLFTSCYHAPRQTAYEAHTHTFCEEMGLYELQQNYIYAGMPYRFFFQFIDNQEAGTNSEADTLLDTMFDFTIESVDFSLHRAVDGQGLMSWSLPQTTQIDPNLRHIEGVYIYNYPCGTVNEPNEANCPHEINAFEIYGNSILDLDLFSGLTECITEACDLKMKIDISIQDQNRRRRMLREQTFKIKTSPTKRMLAIDWNEAAQQKADIQITPPSWNTVMIQVEGSSTADDVKAQIVDCMAGKNVLSHCDGSGAGQCTDITWATVGVATNQFQMSIGNNQYIATAVQIALDDCFSESDAVPLNPTPAPNPDSQNDEVLWIILIGIGGASLLIGGVMYLVLRFGRQSAPVKSVSKFETIRLVNEEGSQEYDQRPLRFAALKYN